MAYSSNMRKGVDIPVWDWLSFFPSGNSFHGTSHAWDGNRYIYWMIQYGSTGAASTTTLNRYDTWSDSWQYMATTTNSYQGLDMEHDPVRNVLIFTTGNNSTEWRVFNLNQTNVTMLGQTIAPWTLTTITTVLPVAANTGASIYQPEDISWNDGITATATGGSTTTVVANSTFIGNVAVGTNPQVGMQIRMTSGAASGQARLISSISTDGLTATVAPAFGSAVAANDTFVLELPTGTATGTQSTTTLQDTTKSMTTNIYSNFDLLITAGTGAGQRRRIASNTATTFTLATAVTGNNRTGAWTTTPDATSVYKIEPSSDFLYYQPGGSTTAIYKIDLNTGTSATTWVTLASAAGAIAGGGHITYMKARAPFALSALRGGGNQNIYQYNIGLNTWGSMSTTFMGSETFTTASTMTSIATEYNKIIMYKNDSVRLYTFDLTTNILEPAGTVPYASATGYEGHRMCFAKSADGVPWVYILRAGGQEFFRIALEWL